MTKVYGSESQSSYTVHSDWDVADICCNYLCYCVNYRLGTLLPAAGFYYLCFYVHFMTCNLDLNGMV
jgi:hypothetical protein